MFSFISKSIVVFFLLVIFIQITSAEDGKEVVISSINYVQKGKHSEVGYSDNNFRRLGKAEKREQNLVRNILMSFHDIKEDKEDIFQTLYTIDYNSIDVTIKELIAINIIAWNRTLSFDVYKRGSGEKLEVKCTYDDLVSDKQIDKSNGDLVESIKIDIHHCSIMKPGSDDMFVIPLKGSFPDNKRYIVNNRSKSNLGINERITIAKGSEVNQVDTPDRTNEVQPL